REREAEAAARATSIAAQEALLQVPEANADRFQERLAAAVAALVRLRNLEDLEARVTALEQRNQELQAEITSLKQSQLSAPRHPNPRSVVVPVSQSNTVLIARSSGTMASAGTGVSSSSGSATSSTLVMILNARTSAQNATVLAGVQYNGPMVDKRAATLPSKYDRKADITSWISSMRSYFEVMRTPQEDRSMIMGTNTEPAVRNHIEIQVVAAGYERIDLTEWLKTLRRAKYKANRDKCEFARQELEYLGHFVTLEGISPLSDKIQAVQEWLEPRNVTEVRSFLGLTGYYQRFIEGYSKIAAHLNKLQCEDRPFDFGEEARGSFLALKAALLSAEVLRIYDPLAPTRVTTDASGYGIGAVLEQHDGVDWHPVEYFSKKVPLVHSIDDARKKEFLAFIHALKRWRHFLLGRSQFRWVTDNNPLVFYKTQDTVNSTIAR
ncbi:hypothetical protein CBR_g60686, partial [Chara braunii]